MRRPLILLGLDRRTRRAMRRAARRWHVVEETIVNGIPTYRATKAYCCFRFTAGQVALDWQAWQQHQDEHNECKGIVRLNQVRYRVVDQRAIPDPHDPDVIAATRPAR